MLMNVENAQYRWPLPPSHEPYLDARNYSRWGVSASITALALVLQWGHSDRPLTRLTISFLLYGVAGTKPPRTHLSCSILFDNLLWLVVRRRVSGANVEQASNIEFQAKMAMQQYKRYGSCEKYKQNQPIIHYAWGPSSVQHSRTDDKCSPDNYTTSCPHIAQGTLAKKV